MKKEDFRIGRRLSCIICGTIINAKIQIESDRIYICNDVYSGDSCRDKLGYKYSWYAGNFSSLPDDPKEYLEGNGLKNIKFKDLDPKSTFAIYSKGEIEFFQTRDGAQKRLRELIKEGLDDTYLIELGKVFQAVLPVTYKLIGITKN